MKGARRALYRGLVMDAAEMLFAERGLSHTSVSGIAEAAGVSRKTLYDCFSCKQEIFDELEAARVAELFSITMASQPADDASAVDVLREGIRAGVGYLIEHPAFLRLHLREGNAWAVHSAGETQPDLGPWREGLAMSARVIERGIREGVFVDERPSLLSKMMTAVYQVQLADWLARRDGTDPVDEGAAEDLVARIESNVLRLLCRPGKDQEQKVTGP